MSIENIDEGLLDVEYIGDGVYVGHDGYQIWLRTPRQYSIHEIALEPPVFNNLIDYKNKLYKKYDAI